MKTRLAPLLILTQLSCAVGPDFVRPDPPPAKSFTRQEITETGTADGKAQRFESGAGVPDNWWRLFHASKLDPIVSQALEKNQTLQAASATLEQNQFNLQAAQGAYYPQVDANVGYSRQKSSPRTFGAGAPSSIFNLFSLSGTISYVLDVFGGQRRAVEGASAQVDVQRYTVLAAYLTLTGNIVSTVISRASLQAQIEATQSMIRSLKEQVTITGDQAKASTVPYTNLVSLQSQLGTVEASLPVIKQRLAQTDHLLANLSGMTPAEWTAPDIKLSDLTLPLKLPKSLPSDLVRQRPDILASEAELHVSSAAVGVATAALFPSFSLNGSYGGNAVSVGGPDGGTGLTSFWNLGANLTAPIFHGGTLRAQKRAAVAAYQASLAQYRQTVLTSFSQVADTLRAIENDAELVAAQSAALSAAGESLRLIQANYQAGTATYLALLVANFQFHQSKIGYLQAVSQRLQDSIALFVALGGGWWNRENLKAPS